jgi:uncharacterized phage-associated protein
MAEIYYIENRGSKMVNINEMTRVDIRDVARAFLSLESMTHKKLQKLCYYAYAWHLAFYNERLFGENFEAWIHGPVCPELYHQYKVHGWQEIPKVDLSALDTSSFTYQFISNVYDSYGHLDGNELEYLTHTEDPWIEARGGLPEIAPCNNVINDQTIRSFYQQVLENEQQD